MAVILHQLNYQLNFNLNFSDATFKHLNKQLMIILLFKNAIILLKQIIFI